MHAIRLVNNRHIYRLKFEDTFLNQINEKLKIEKILPNFKKRKEVFFMAKIIESKRRIVKLSVDDVLNIVREYQRLTQHSCCYEHTREILSKNHLYVPED